MNMRLTKSVSMLLLVAGCALPLSAQNYGKPYQPFRPYKRGMAEVELATMSTPSGATPRRSPGGGGTGKTDVDNPGLQPIGDGIGFLLMMGLLYMMIKYVLKHVKNSTFLTKCHQMIE